MMRKSVAVLDFKNWEGRCEATPGEGMEGCDI